MTFQPRFMATHLSAMAHRDPEQACRLILGLFPEAPCLPRLTRSTRMYLEGMPCAHVDSERGKIIFDLSAERAGELERFYERVLEDDLDYFAIGERWAPATYRLLRELQCNPPPELKVVHIQTPGPVSWAMSAVDETGSPAFYNEVLRDIMVKQLAMKARWQERLVREMLPDVPILVEYGEPSLVIHTSAVGSGARGDLIRAIDEVLDAVDSMAGVHCCANIDWSILLQTKTDYINFDAFEYADRVALYTDDLKPFLARGGMLAWGIVPTMDEKLAGESVDSLTKRLEDAISLMVQRGVDRAAIVEASWVTPTCATTSMSIEMSERAFAFTSEIGRRMRAKYFGE